MSIDTLVRDLQLDPETADQLFRTARTAREFTDTEVSVEQIRDVYDLIKWGPTAMNIVPLRLLVLRRGAARERLVPLMAEGNRERVATAPMTLVLAADPAFYQHMGTLFPHAPQVQEQLSQSPEACAPMARTNALIQAGYLIVGLRAAGLATGPMNGMDFDAVDAEFFAENGWQSLMVVNVGYTEGSGTALPRLPRLEFADAATVL
ncbi:malonic semialdehyde reductase [Ruania zhangjianzhongii]|uniref:malonic semialdehyde reductase n=1 Tax=Ruania zhangjianzhongii TaxID=2603206 RepID=UPI0011C70B0B|nr:malonic semialdehyde reductase [Ruania zhangjianzhongii]